MKNITARRAIKHSRLFILLFAILCLSAIAAVPLYSGQSKSVSRLGSAPDVSGANASARTSHKSVMKSRLTSLTANASRFAGAFSSLTETIQTYAGDCETPKSTFILGETVCAGVSGVTETNRFVNWLSPPDSSVAFTSPTIPDSGTHYYTYTPAVAGVWKATIADPSDSSIIPVTFTVVAPGTLATYASNCITPKTDFNLGETICIKVTGLSSEEFPQRRLQLAGPDGFVLASFDIIDNSQQFTYQLPATDTESFGGQTIDHRGTWVVALVNPDKDLVIPLPVVVHKSNLLIDRVADLQISKLLIPSPDPPEAGFNVSFQLTIINQGPDPATNPRLADFTLPNTTFVSFNRQTFIGSNMLDIKPNGMGGENSFLNSDVQFFGGPADSMNVIPNAGLAAFSDTSLTFTCTSPSVGSAGSTTCSASGQLAPGETATFTAVYQIGSSLPPGTQISDNNSATVGSDTTDQFANSNTQATSITTTTSNPPACLITCPDNITVGTTTTGGAIVTFATEPAGSCGTVTSSPASGSFFPVGTTPVTTTTSQGASCQFNVTVVNTPQPTITCAADQSAVASSGQTETSVTVTEPTYAGSFTQGQFPPPLTSSRSDQRLVTDPYPIGTTIITWTVTDQYGTAKSCTQRIVVTSSDTPTITCPSNKTFAAASGDCQATLTAAQIGTPTVGGLNTTFTSSRSDNLALLDPYPAGQTFITWTATNALGSASCTQVITITTTGDTTPPVLTVPPDINISTSECSVLLDDELGVATATDTCSAGVTITRTGLPQIPCPIPGDPNHTCDSFVFPTGTTIITYTATDAAGNTTVGQQLVNIAENPVIFPTISAPANVNVNTLPTDTVCGTFVGDATLGTATASDNCPGVVVTRTGVPAGNIFPVGVTTVTYTATDRTGHSTSATQTVTVNDATPPIISCPSSITLEPTCPTGAIGTYTEPVGTDNCPGATTTRTAGPASGSVFPIGATTVTYTVNDAHGNSASCSFTVTVLTPQAVIQNLINQVNASSLTGTQKNGLLAKLNAALSAINGGQTNIACNKLSEFVNNVQNYISHGDLTATQGNAWILSANHVRNTIGCTNNQCS